MSRTSILETAEPLRPHKRSSAADDVTYVYDDVTYVYDHVTYVFDDVPAF